MLISCITACGICDFCRRSMPSPCRTCGWIRGNTIDGTQAEYVRIPMRTQACTACRVGLDDIMQAYDTFADAAKPAALKVILNGRGPD